MVMSPLVLSSVVEAPDVLRDFGIHLRPDVRLTTTGTPLGYPPGKGTGVTGPVEGLGGVRSQRHSWYREGRLEVYPG